MVEADKLNIKRFLTPVYISRYILSYDIQKTIGIEIRIFGVTVFVYEVTE